MNEARKLLVITFRDSSSPFPIEKQPKINVPAFVENFAEAELVGLIYAEKFPTLREGQDNKNAKLVIQSIVEGGLLLLR